ncbi:hypothetical protein HHK36_019591 [Tetracentron sinense]|uniref:Cytochrome P450 n=1 Tax=Tetracentron sinense TaxID=13715 RepID=A0A835DA65_TETSI|nr:hypothetical protein HHK36_019591 [Tetracentron sinense]
MNSCEVPYTLLGFLLQRDRSKPRTCSAEEDSNFFRDYAAREINALLWISLILITALLLRKVTQLLRLWAKGRNIPGPPCPSFYGHSKLISGTKSGENLNNFLSMSHEKYGSVVRLWLGPTQLLVSIKDPALIKEMLIKAEDKLPLTGKAFRLAFGRSSLFVSSFDKVQKRRESLAIELNRKLLERAYAIPSKAVDCVMERVHNIMAQGVLDCKLVSQHLAFSILGATLFGDAFLAWSKAIVYEELLMMIAKDACFWASYSVPPFWKQGFWRYQSLCRKLKFLTQDIIRQCSQNYKLFGQMDLNSRSEATNVGKEDAINAAVSSSGMIADNFLEELHGHHNAREESCGNIMGVMFHGCLTTAGLIGNILARLATHPDIQDKVDVFYFPFSFGRMDNKVVGWAAVVTGAGERAAAADIVLGTGATVRECDSNGLELPLTGDSGCLKAWFLLEDGSTEGGLLPRPPDAASVKQDGICLLGAGL